VVNGVGDPDTTEGYAVAASTSTDPDRNF